MSIRIHKTIGRVAAAILSAILLASVTAPQAEAAPKSPKITIKKYRITGIKPESLRSVEGTIELTLENKSAALMLRNINGKIYKNGVDFIQGYCLDVEIPRGISVITIHGNASLCEGVSLLEVLKLVNFNPDDFTVDFSVNCTFVRGKGLKIARNGIPLRQILE